MIMRYTLNSCKFTVKPRLSGHVHSRENSRIYEVSVFMKHNLLALVVYVEC